MNRSNTAWVLWLIPSVYFLFVAAESAALTFLSLAATQAGASALNVGLLAAGLWTGILFSSVAAHAISKRLGFGLTFFLGTTLAFLSISSFSTSDDLKHWIAGSLSLGLGGGLVWVVGESWLANAAPAQHRGRYVGWFEAAVGFGLMAGPLAIPLAALIGLHPLMLAIALMSIALLGSVSLWAIVKRTSTDQGSNAEPTDAKSWYRVTFPLLVVALISGVLESGVSALLPSISMRLGASMEVAALMGTVIGAGSALLQPPAGRAADRWGTRNMIVLCWLVLLASTTLLLGVAADPGALLWGVAFALGGVGGAVYTLCIVELGNRLDGPSLVKAISALVISYSLGTAAAPPLGGLLFDQFGLKGFASALAGLSLVGTAIAVLTLLSRPRKPETQQASGEHV